MVGPVYDQEMGQWRRRHNWELREQTKQPHISQIVKGRRIQWAGHVARMEEERMPKRVFLAQVDGRRPPGRPRKDWRRCLEEINVESDLCNPEHPKSNAMCECMMGHLVKVTCAAINE